jgi:alkanesulfonate monooxygenase SsuD/methylene tetrahydromethanopterin reductase-like flavin-dependent oxidoreductase (luciferase family)
MTFQLGVDSFGNRTDDGGYGATAQAIRNVLEAVHLAEEVGLDFFGFGEHQPARCRYRRRPRSSTPPPLGRDGSGSAPP